MVFKEGGLYHGFRLERATGVDEINSRALLFFHEKTGARLLKLENSDDNKVFSISFRTPPSDDTGLPHILEHSVLTGSRKFPTREPFVELLKGSLNTFLNAMTFPDKTMYPVASKNGKDFFNLMDVYLDAVLYPNIYANPLTLLQEGWHYAIDNPEGEIARSGVVYNEMKGAFSSPDNLIFSVIQKSLYPETIYSKESGGDPEFIPDLTQEAFIEFHKRYYHPSNGYLFLYGDGDTIRELAFINDEYLSAFDAVKIDSRITAQHPFHEMTRMTVDYPVSADEDTAGKTDISLNFVIGEATDPMLRYGMEILARILLSTPASPLKLAIQRSGIGKDVIGVYESGLLQPFFSIILKRSDEEKAEEFMSIINDCLRSLITEGISTDLVEASINFIEFQLREAEFPRYPKGLYYNMVALESWLYDADPLMHLNFSPWIKKIREFASKGYFEDLIRMHLLENMHRSLLVLRPRQGLAEERERADRERLASFKSSLSREAIMQLVEGNRKLNEYQSTPDTEENLAKIPMLAINDINREPERIPSERRDLTGIPVVHTPVPTSGIAYLSLVFDPTAVEEEMLPYLGLLGGLMGKVSTKKRRYEELSNLLNRYTGGTFIHLNNYSERDEPWRFHPRLIVKSKVLFEQLPRALPVVGELIADTIFTEKERIREVIREMKSRYEMQVIPQGHIVARKRALSYFSPMEKFDDLAGGISFYRFLAKTERDYDALFPSLCDNLARVHGAVFGLNNLTLGITSDEAGYARVAMEAGALTANLPDTPFTAAGYSPGLAVLNEGFMLPQSQVQYIAKACNFTKHGCTFSGKMNALSSVIRLDYLWNRVRVQGGAYGAFINIQRNGNMSFGSYRDPSLSSTLDVFDGTGGYLESFDASDREMTKYVIGTISDLDQHLTPSQKGEVSLRHSISGITYEDIRREREEVLSVTAGEIREFASLAACILRETNICVIGSESRIQGEKHLFNTIEPLFE